MEKILAIDDKEDNLISLSAILKSFIPGCAVITALSGLEGIEKAKDESPDTILLDIIMPDMDGYEVCKRLKENKNTKHIPVIMISGILTGPTNLIKGLDIGADAYLTKPIDEHVLIAQVKMALRMKTAEDTLRREKDVLEDMVLDRTAGLTNSNRFLKREIKVRKQAEENLQKSETKLKHIIGIVPGIIATANALSGYFTYCNLALSSILGFSSEEFLARPFIEFIHPDDRQNTLNEVEKQLEGGPVVRFENRYICKDGSYRWLEWRATVADEKGLVYAAATDITERKKIESDLKEHVNNFNDLLDNSKILLYKFNLKTKNFDFLGQAMETFVGISVDDYIKGGIELAVSILHPDDRDRHDEHLKNLLAGTLENDMQHTIEYRFKNAKTGQYRWFSDNLAVVFDDDGKPAATVGSLIDITERKKAEHSLQKSEETFQIAMGATKDGIYDWNLVTNEIYYSPGWKRMLGYQENELPNDFSIWEKLTEPEDVKLSWEMQQELINKKRDRFELEFKMKHKDGHWIDVLSRAKAIFDDSGKAVRIVGTHVDITTNKQAEEALRKSESLHSEAQRVAKLGHWELDSPSGTPMWSEETYRIFGLDTKKSEPSFVAHKNIIHNEDWDLLNSSIQMLSTKGTPFDIKFRILRSNGQIGWMHAKGSAKKSEDGSVHRMFGTAQDITERKRIEKALEKSHELLEEKVIVRTAEIQEMNTALKVLLKKRDDDKKEMEEKIFTNYKSLISPFLQKLKSSLTKRDQQNLMDIVESNLKEFLQPFSQKLSNPMVNLTPTEIQIASMVKQGLSNKEIAQTLNSSIRTITNHRQHIRIKLGLKNKKINLRSFLSTL